MKNGTNGALGLVQGHGDGDVKVGPGWIYWSVGPCIFFGCEVEPSDEDDEDELVVQPCYSLMTMANEKGVNTVCLPYGEGLFSESVPVRITHYDTLVRLDDADEGDLAKFQKLVAAAEKTKMNMRAASAGIQLLR
jgi:hypothetical protein